MSVSSAAGAESSARRAVEEVMRLLLSTALIALAASLPVLAETQVETINENRLNLFFKLPEAEAQALLPEPWSVAPLPGGPAAGANALMIMLDRISAVGPDQKPLDPGENRLAVLVVFGQDAAAGAGGPVVVAGWSDAAAGAPGAYGNYSDADVTYVRRIAAGEKTAVEEEWSVSGEGGARFEVALAYARNAPAFSTFDQKVYSGSDPSFYRIYRGDQGAIVVMSGPLAIGFADDVTIKAEGDVLGALFDEEAELVAVLHLPWYRRDSFLP
jgi:hypothetical protein